MRLSRALGHECVSDWTGDSNLTDLTEIIHAANHYVISIRISRDNNVFFNNRNRCDDTVFIIHDDSSTSFVHE